MKKLIVLFPGAGYGLDCPLLYYADFLYETKGFDRIHLNYQNILSNSNLSLEERLLKIRAYISEQIRDVNFTSYDEIIFLSKSVGSVEAGILAEKLGINVIQIFITPIEQAISYCRDDSYVIIGTLDTAYQIYKKYCDAHEIKVLYLNNANHSLEVEGQPYQSIDILKMVLQFIER